MRTTIARLTRPGEFFEVGNVATPRGVCPAFVNAPATLVDIVRSAREHGELDFIVHGESRLSFTGFFDNVHHALGYLQSRGLGRGDRLAIAMRNRPEWLIAFTAAVLAGAVVVPINSWGRRQELLQALGDCAPDILVCDAQRASLLEEHGLEVHLIVATDDATDGVERASPAVRFRDVINHGVPGLPVDVEPDDLALILYTSGSTGAPPEDTRCRQLISKSSILGWLSRSFTSAGTLLNSVTRSRSISVRARWASHRSSMTIAWPVKSGKTKEPSKPVA